MNTIDGRNLTAFEELVKQRCGICLDTRNEAVENAIDARMQANRQASVARYQTMLEEDRSEFANFVNLLTINETYFFREPQHFEVLTRRVMPQLLSEKEARKIRILSVGCSTGEEPYSIAISLSKALGNTVSDMTIYGVDIDTHALALAKNGIYSKNAFRNISHASFDRFFHDIDRYRVRLDDAIRSLVRFKNVNIVDQSFPFELMHMDVIFYRNLSIYFDKETRLNVLKRLAAALNEGGHLFVGLSEIQAHELGILETREVDGIFVFQKPGFECAPLAKSKKKKKRKKKKKKLAIALQESNKTSKGTGTTQNNDHPTGMDRAQVEQLLKDAQHAAQNRRFEQANKLIERVLAQSPNQEQALLLRATIDTNHGRIDDAIRICNAIVAHNPFHLEAQILLGLNHQRKNEMDKAAEQFRKAIFVDATHWLAHFYLAECYIQQSKFKVAAREYRLSTKHLAHAAFPPKSPLLYHLPFTKGQLMASCRQKQRLAKSKVN